MKLLWLSILLTLTACSTLHSNAKPAVKVDYCLNDKDNNDYINSHFTKPLELEINTTDPSGASVLISAAINGRLGDTVAAKSVSAHVLDITHGSPMLSFVDIQNVTKHNNIFQQQYDLNTQTIKTDYQLKFFVIPQYRLTF